MKEVLFVDDARLDRYAEQVNPSLTAIDKARKFGFELSITVPKAALGQEERPRAWTRFEKMNAVLEHLREQNDLRAGRPTDENEGPAFVHESCIATKIIVPYAATAGDFKNPELGLWFSSADEFTGSRLCLVEDFRDVDERPVSFKGASTYTLLQSLIAYTRSRSQTTLLDKYVPNEPHPNPYASFENKPPSSREYHNVKNFCYEFAMNPAALLGSWGCLVRTSCRIETLYRIREWGRDAANSWTTPSVFGYPIWIIQE